MRIRIRVRIPPSAHTRSGAKIRGMARYVLRVNGRDREVDAEPGDNLLSILRDDFALTGSRFGCGEGQCGACTVHLDGARRAVLRHPRREHRHQGHHDHRGARGRRPPPPRSAGVSRGRSLPVRLLHVRNDHGHGRIAAHQPESIGRGRPPAARSKRVPLRDVSATRPRGSAGSRAHTRDHDGQRGRTAMSVQSTRMSDANEPRERSGEERGPRERACRGDRRGEAPRIEIEVERYELSESRRYTFELERRDFIRVFGAGLLVLVAAPELPAQESGRGARGNGDVPDLAAWLHIDEAGQVTACTGKVEIGQNIRTSLSQTVADELRVPVTSVTMVMGDTERTPFDMGTFGSLTTPRMAPQLARAAATAREMLIDQAASRWQIAAKRARRAEWPDRVGRRPIAVVRRADEGPGVVRDDSLRAAGGLPGPMEGSRHSGEEDRRPRLRHGPSSVHTRRRASRHAARSHRSSRRLWRDARLRRRQPRPLDAGRVGRARRRLPRRRRTHRTRRDPCRVGEFRRRGGRCPTSRPPRPCSTSSRRIRNARAVAEMRRSLLAM